MKVLIADDEKNICLLLHSLIDWEGLGLSPAGEANDGVAARDQILETKPDIVIMDIKMPEMDGLEVIRQVKAKQQDTLFLLISGHREFEYAHAAIQYGVDNYLLKPIGKQALNDALRQAVAKLNAQRAQSDRTGQDAAEMRALLMQHLLSMPNALKDKSLQEINRFYCVRFGSGYYQAMCLQPDARMSLDAMQYQNLLRQVEAWFRSALETECTELFTCVTEYRCWLLCYRAESPLPLSACEALLENAKKQFYPFCQLTLGLSRTVSQLRELVAEEALMAVRQRLCLDCGRVILYGTHHFEPVHDSLARHENDMWKLMEMDDEGRIRHWFDTVLARIITATADPNDVVQFMGEVVSRYGTWLQSRLSAAQTERLSLQLRDTLEMSPSLQRLMDGILSSLLETHGALIAERQKLDSAYVGRAKEYIQEHCRENITLEDISRIIFINPTYFSTLFKKEEGINFSEYLTKYRLERAKILLQDFSLSIAEVALQVGYQDTRHFSKIFFKAFGIKPSEYRRLF